MGTFVFYRWEKCSHSLTVNHDVNPVLGVYYSACQPGSILK